MSAGAYYLYKKDTYGSSYSQYSVDSIINEAVNKAVQQSHDALCDEKDGIATMNQAIDRKIASDVKPMIMDCVDAIDLLETNCDKRLDNLEEASLAINNLLKEIDNDIERLDKETSRFEGDIVDLKLKNTEYNGNFTNIDKRFTDINSTYLKISDTPDAIGAFLRYNVFDNVDGTAQLKNTLLTRYDTSIKDTYLTKVDATSTYQTIADTTYKYEELKGLIGNKPTYKEVEDNFYSKQSAQQLISRIETLERLVSELQTKVESLETANQKHTGDINKLEGNIEKVNLENNQFQELINGLRSDLTATQSLDNQQSTVIQELINAVQSLNTTDQKQTTDINQLKSDLSVNNELDKTQSNQIDDLNTWKDQTDLHIQGIESDIKGNEQGIEDIKNDMSTHSQRIEEISGTLNSHGDSIQQLENEVFNF